MSEEKKGLSFPHRAIIGHALGVLYRDKPYRNHYYALANDRDCNELCKLGLMNAGDFGRPETYRYFHVTEAGAAAIGSKLPEDD